LLSGGNSQVSLGFPDFWLDGLFSLDFGPRLSSDTSLGFECSSVPLSGLDFSHGTFLVLPSVKDGPGDLSRILLGLEFLFGFTVDQDDSFTVSLDVGFTVARVDGHSGEVANFGSHFVCGVLDLLSKNIKNKL